MRRAAARAVMNRVRVDPRGLGRSAGGPDLAGQRVELLARAAGEEDRGALARERARGSAADRSSGPVDHRVLALEQHLDTSCLMSSFLDRPRSRN
jgi:hypothetical protein